MAVFRCKMCGGSLEVAANQTTAVCEYCGTIQTLPRLNDEKIANLYDRANHFRRNNDYDKALGIYEQILCEDRSDSEAYWSIVLCRYGIEYVEDPTTKKRIPTINRTQLASIFSDADYRSAILYADDAQKEIYEAEAKAIDDIQKRILEVYNSGESFDIFICYKDTDNNGRRTPDSVLANDLYNELTEEGYKVFFSRITLEDKLGEEYEPHIFAALNSAKVMVVVGTRPEYFNAVWVKNEWSRYLALIKNGAKKILIPAYRDMDPYDLPEEFSHLQAQDMSKLGFMQDLVRGIKKILNPENGNTAVVKNENSSVESNIDYAILLIEDGEIEKAQKILEQTVAVAPKHPMIYLGRLLIECGVRKQEDLANLEKSFENSSNYQKAVRFANPQLKSELESYLESIKNNKVVSAFNQAVEKMNAAVSEEDFLAAKKIFESVLHYSDAAALASVCGEKAAEAHREALYQKAVNIMQENTDEKIKSLKNAIDCFEQIRDYKDSEMQIDKCKRLINEENAFLKKKKKIIKIAAVSMTGAAVILVAVLILYFIFILPENSYKKAEAFFADKNYSDAYNSYKWCGNYKDAEEKSKECLYIMATDLRNNKKWDEANELFEKIKDYKDSEALIHIHNYEVTASQKATCEKDGYNDYKCGGCGETYREVLKATGHDYADATCTTPKKCKNCGKTNGKALGHTTDTAVCSRCGVITFKTLKYSGSGPGNITGINLPIGKYNVTFTHSGSSNFVVQGSTNMDVWVNEIGKVSYVCQIESGMSIGISGIKNGYINIKMADGPWTVTIEALK